MEIRAQGTHRQPRDIFELLGRREQIERMARAMQAIAHPLRLKILCVLGEHELSVQDIVEAVGTSQSNVSQHLAILREKRILSTRKNANHVYYSVSDQRTLRDAHLAGGAPRSDRGFDFDPSGNLADQPAERSCAGCEGSGRV